MAAIHFRFARLQMANLHAPPSYSFRCFFLFFSLAIPTVASAAEPKGAAAPSPSPTPAEVYCEAEIFYSWKRLPNTKDKDAPPADESAQEIFFLKVIERGQSSEIAEQKAKQSIFTALAKAQETCREQHENQSGCMMSQMNAFDPNIKTLDFETRRMILEQIEEDCARQTGLCVGTRAGEMTCNNS
jgi:hypothetical protein